MKRNTKPATVTELLATVDAFNKAHELDLRDVRSRGKANPFLENLYEAATNAAKSLQPLVKVEIKMVKQ